MFLRDVHVLLELFNMSNTADVTGGKHIYLTSIIRDFKNLLSRAPPCFALPILTFWRHFFYIVVFITFFSRFDF
jgi:hypothetical protein